MGYKRNTFGNKKIYIASAVSLLSICAIAGGFMIKSNEPKKQDNTAYIVDLNDNNAENTTDIANSKIDAKNKADNSINEEQTTREYDANRISNEDNGDETKDNKVANEDETKDNKVANEDETKDNKAANEDETKDNKVANEDITKDDLEAAGNVEKTTKDKTQEAGVIGTDITGLNFSKESTLVWPVEGQIVIDYDMENVVYFPTLDVYKCSDAVCVQSKEGTPVYAGANGTVLEIAKDSQIGNYVKMNLGNGYEIVYGSLKDIQVSNGLTIREGDLIGYVASPTKYYSLEGEHLYIKMTENGKSIDPVDFLNYE